MQKAVFETEPLTCPTCAQKIEVALGKQAGVQEVKVMFHSAKVKVTFDEHQLSAEELEQTITRLGYQVLGVSSKSVLP